MGRWLLVVVTVLLWSSAMAAQAGARQLPVSSDPVALAEAAATTYWADAGYPATPCRGDLVVQVAPISPATTSADDQAFGVAPPTGPLAVELARAQIAAVTDYVNQFGQEAVIAGDPTLFTSCLITLNPYYWGSKQDMAGNYVNLCATELHEWGNAEGVPENTNPRSVMDRFDPRAPAVCLLTGVLKVGSVTYVYHHGVLAGEGDVG